MSDVFKCSACGRAFEAGDSGCSACTVLTDPTGEFAPMTAKDFVDGMREAMMRALLEADPDDVAKVTGHNGPHVHCQNEDD